jgi:hypothetical protein
MAITNHAFYTLMTEYKTAKQAIQDLAKINLPGIDAVLLESQLEESYQSAIRAVEQAVPINQSLIPPLPPKIDRSSIKGIVAYRAWNLGEGGYLAPAIQYSKGAWKEIMFADEPPTLVNHHGLHATRLHDYNQNRYGNSYSGLIDMFGKVVEHSDNVMRSECARILVLMVDVDSNEDIVKMATGTYEMLCRAYPHVQVYLMNRWQKDLYMMREILISSGVDLT